MLFDKIYLRDIMERNRIMNEQSVLDDILNIISSSVGSPTRVSDSFKKIVVVKDDIEPWIDEKGIQYIGVQDFLLDEEFLR